VSICADTDSTDSACDVVAFLKRSTIQDGKDSVLLIRQDRRELYKVALLQKVVVATAWKTYWLGLLFIASAQ
jgi:hypothetical protein